jgi:hypothetical protein
MANPVETVSEREQRNKRELALSENERLRRHKEKRRLRRENLKPRLSFEETKWSGPIPGRARRRVLGSKPVSFPAPRYEGQVHGRGDRDLEILRSFCGAAGVPITAETSRGDDKTSAEADAEGFKNHADYVRGVPPTARSQTRKDSGRRRHRRGDPGEADGHRFSTGTAGSPGRSRAEVPV